jgi:hypothetical protein
LLISALVRHQGEADAGTGFFILARAVGLIHGSMSDLARVEFWLRHVRQVQAYNWDQVSSDAASGTHFGNPKRRHATVRVTELPTLSPPTAMPMDDAPRAERPAGLTLSAFPDCGR